MQKEELVEQLREANEHRWIGKSEYSCLSCSHSMSREDEILICVANAEHKEVDDEHLCKEWS